MSCVVIKDRFGDCHATKLYGAATPEAIREAAGYLAHRVAVADPGEQVKVGLSASEPGLARLRDGVPYADGGIEWLYDINADELEEAT